MLLMIRNTSAGMRAACARIPLMVDRRAVTAIEYAIIAGVIVTALVVSVSAIGPQVAHPFNQVSSEL